jgi:hypothetical protein
MDGRGQTRLVPPQKRISKPTLVAFEAGRTEPHPATMSVLRQALEERGVVFIDANGTGPGVCLKK